MRKNQEEINEIQNIEIELLLEALYRRYGYDFRDYSRAHVKRRILNRLASSQLKCFMINSTSSR